MLILKRDHRTMQNFYIVKYSSKDFRFSGFYLKLIIDELPSRKLYASVTSHACIKILITLNQCEDILALYCIVLLIVVGSNNVGFYSLCHSLGFSVITDMLMVPDLERTFGFLPLTNLTLPNSKPCLMTNDNLILKIL